MKKKGGKVKGSKPAQQEISKENGEKEISKENGDPQLNSTADNDDLKDEFMDSVSPPPPAPSQSKAKQKPIKAAKVPKSPVKSARGPTSPVKSLKLSKSPIKVAVKSAKKGKKTSAGRNNFADLLIKFETAQAQIAELTFKNNDMEQTIFNHEKQKKEVAENGAKEGEIVPTKAGGGPTKAGGVPTKAGGVPTKAGGVPTKAKKAKEGKTALAKSNEFAAKLYKENSDMKLNLQKLATLIETERREKEEALAKLRCGNVSINNLEVAAGEVAELEANAEKYKKEIESLKSEAKANLARQAKEAKVAKARQAKEAKAALVEDKGRQAEFKKTVEQMETSKQELKKSKEEVDKSKEELEKSKEEMEKAKLELEMLTSEFKKQEKIFESLKETQDAKLDKLDKKLSEQQKLNKKLETQRSVEKKGREAAEEQLKAQLEGNNKLSMQLKAQLDANNKLSILTNLTQDKNDQRFILESDLAAKIEENKVLEQQCKNSDDKVQKLEKEYGRITGQQSRVERELVTLKRENFQKETILGEVRVQMSLFESNWRAADDKYKNLKAETEMILKEAAGVRPELDRIMRENISLVEEKKTLIAEVRQFADLQKKYKKLKETLQRYVEKHRWCREKHRSLEMEHSTTAQGVIDPVEKAKPAVAAIQRTASIDDDFSRSPSNSMTPPPPELGKQAQVSAIKETNTLSANKETDIIRNYNLPLTSLRALVPQDPRVLPESAPKLPDKPESSDIYDPEESIGGSSPYDPEGSLIDDLEDIAQHPTTKEAKVPAATPSIYINPKIYSDKPSLTLTSQSNLSERPAATGSFPPAQLQPVVDSFPVQQLVQQLTFAQQQQMNGLTSAGDRASAGLSAGDRASAASAVDPAAMIGQPPGAVSEQDILGARFREADGMLQAWIQRMEKERRQVRSRHPSVEEVQAVGSNISGGHLVGGGVKLQRRGTNAEEDAVIILSDTINTRKSRDSRDSKRSRRKRKKSRSRSSSYSSSSSSSRSRHKHKSRRSRRRHSGSRSRSRSKHRSSKDKSRDKRRKTGYRTETSRRRKHNSGGPAAVVNIGDKSSSEDDIVALPSEPGKQLVLTYPSQRSMKNETGFQEVASSPFLASSPFKSNLPSSSKPTTLGHVQPGSLGYMQAGSMGHMQNGVLGHLTSGPLGHMQNGSLGTVTSGALGHVQAGSIGHVTSGAPGHVQTGSYMTLAPSVNPANICLPNSQQNKVSDGAVASQVRPSIEIKEELLSGQQLEGSAYTVQWRDHCPTCGVKMVNSDHFDAKGVCKRKVSWEKKGLKTRCKYCNESSHWIDGCPFLSSFCFRCWCWGHTDGCHDKLDQKFISSLLDSYSKYRLMFHPGVKEHNLPANTKTKEGWRYLGSRAELVIIAENLQPDGTYQPWLHPSWNQF